MSHVRFIALSAVTFFFLAPVARADWISSFLQKAAVRAAANDGRAIEPNRWEARGVPQPGAAHESKSNSHFHLGDTGYRLTKRGLKANFAFGSVSAVAQFGESGKHRLELDSPMLPRNSTLALSNDGNGVVRLELTFGF
jgi:hypothetical protein